MILTDLLRAKPVQLGHEDGQRGVDPHHPRKGHHVVETAQQHCRFHYHFHKSHRCLGEGVALVTRSPLLNTDQAQKSRVSCGLLVDGDAAVVVRLVHE